MMIALAQLPLAQLPAEGMDPLRDLRDIHLPPPPSWWPPAPGWWLAAVLVALALVLAARAARHRWRGTRARRAALDALRRLRRRHGAGEPADALVAELNLLLRRVAMTRWPRERVAGIIGGAWLAFLDETSAHSQPGSEPGSEPGSDPGSDPGFVDGAGRALASAAYRPGEPVDMDALLELSERWVRHNA